MRNLLFFMLFTHLTSNLAVGNTDVMALEQVPGSPWFGLGEEELSGLALSADGARLWAVADKDDNRALYTVKPGKEQRFNLQSFINLEKLKGYKSYRASMDQVIQLKEKDRRHDFEGIARCGDDFYLADERVRKVIMLSKGTIKEIKLKLNSIKDLWRGSANAGFEGIAVNCDAKHLFLAKERDPRILIKIDLKSGKILKQTSNLPLSSRDGQKVIDFRQGDGLLEISRDISDLVFSEGSLYLLERYTREIVKVDPETFKELNRVSYFFAEFGLYQSPYPFGLAEGLAISKEKIYIGIDHNREHLSEKSWVKYGVKGAHPAIFIFKRPKDF